MLSISTGNWFISPLFVLGSHIPGSRDLSLCFQGKAFKDLNISIKNEKDEILLSEKLPSPSPNFQVSMGLWPNGEYHLLLEAEEYHYSYKVLLK